MGSAAIDIRLQRETENDKNSNSGVTQGQQSQRSSKNSFFPYTHGQYFSGSQRDTVDRFD